MGSSDSGAQRATRILLVTDFYPPLIGGATRSAQLLAHELVRRGYDVAVATAWQRGTPTEERDELGVVVYRLHGLTMRLTFLSADPYQRISPPFPDPELVLRLRRIVRKERPDIVHSFGWLSYSCAAALLGSDVPFVLAARDYENVCSIGTLLRGGREICQGPAAAKCLACAANHFGPPKGMVAAAGVLTGRRLLRRKVRAVQSVSTFVRDVLREHLLDGGSGADGGNRGVLETVIPDFRVPCDDQPDETVLMRLPAEPFILFVGAFRRGKGVEALLSAYGRLVDPPPLVMIGTRATDMPAAFPPDVTVEYDVPHATVMAAWDRALFGVAPSLWPEPLGNVVHEAMSRGKTVVGTRPGGHAEMIASGVDGLLVDAGDVDALAEAMRLLIADDELRHRLEMGARAHAEVFTSSVQMPRFEALFRDVLESARGLAT